MKVYAIAIMINQCYGHGDYGYDIVIPVLSGYDGSSLNPKVFLNKDEAERSIGLNEVVVELNVVEGRKRTVAKQP